MGNARNRYFLSTKKNFIGGINFPYCMLDSGCNTHLLPMDDEIYKGILHNFLNDSYIWNVKQGKGVAAFNSPVLIISHFLSVGNPVRFSLFNDKYFETTIPNLRFHISLQDAQNLMKNKNLNKQISGENRRILNDFVECCDFLKKRYPEKSFGERRKHVLIGQDIIKKFVFVEFGQVALFLDPQTWDEKTSVFIRIKQLTQIAQGNILQEFTGNEFENLEDEDHDYTGDYKIYEEVD